MMDGACFENHYSAMSLEEKLSFQISHLSRLMSRVPGAMLGQSKILNILTEKGDCTQRELTEAAGIQPGSMSEILKKLEIGGYIHRFPDPKDGRGFVICLTEAGRIAAKSVSESTENVFSVFSDEEKDQLLALLEKLEKSWREKLPQPSAQGPFAEIPQKA